MSIHFGVASEAGEEFFQTLERIAAEPGVRRVAEIGGGANPLFSPDLIRRHGLDYTVIDISAEELAKAPEGYHKMVADLSAPAAAPRGEYDLVFSQWLAEHVQDAETFHRNVHGMLAAGGRAVHLFPTLYSPPFVLNRLIPETLAERLLVWLQPHRAPEGSHGKFPAYYRWCRGPSGRQIRRFQRLGYGVDFYGGFFGHSGQVAFGSGYLDRIGWLTRWHERIARRLARHPIAALTTISYVVLSKPTAARLAEPGFDRDDGELVVVGEATASA